MADSIRIKRGVSLDLPSSLPMGELAFCTDTKELWIGQGDNQPLQCLTSSISSDLLKRLSTIDTDIVEINEKIEYLMEHGGGGGGSKTPGELSSNFTDTICNYGEDITVDYYYSQSNYGTSILHIELNNKEVETKEINAGNGTYTFTGLKKGKNTLKLYVVDGAGLYTNQLTFNVNCGSLEITSDFKATNDYLVSSVIKFNYTISSIYEDDIKLIFKLDNETQEINSKKGYNSYNIGSLTAGVHPLTVYCKCGSVISNKLVYNVVVMDSTSLYISSLFNQAKSEKGDRLIVDYRLSKRGENYFNVKCYVDDNLRKTSKVPAGTNYWTVSDLTVGTHVLKIEASTLDGTQTEGLLFNIEITASTFSPNPPTNAGLLCWFDATDKSNTDTDKETWTDKSGNNTVITLNNFNYGSNGWINNRLKFTGDAYAEIDLAPFKENADYGLTIDISYSCVDCGVDNTRVIDCTNAGGNNNGIYIDTQKAFISSKSNFVSTTYNENTDTKITFVVDRDLKYAKIYANAILTEVFKLTDTGNELENFQHNGKILLNCDRTKTIFGNCDIKSLRVYERALTDEEIVDLYIYDIDDKETQKEEYNKNFNNEMATMYFYGDVSTMTKENKVRLRVKYLATEGCGENFDIPNCIVSWQGTSSLVYAVKNYKIKLRDANDAKVKYSPFKDGIEESTFCLKADYMDSSHANNTVTAQLINDAYTEKVPPQKINSKVRTTINGFPIQLYINDEFQGIYNFNLDKGCEASFGLDTNQFPKCLSYEVAANTDNSAGAFYKYKSNSSSNGLTEIKYFERDFELRYPEVRNTEDGTDNYAELIRLVNWVSDADDTTFKNEIDQYFNKDYLLTYFVQVMMLAMVDNLGKNMMLTTWDGVIWYPQFYDLDTLLGLDNTGYLKFDSDVEMDASIFNTSNSQLWVKVQRVFADEIKAKYADLRNTLYTFDNFVKYYYTNQINKIGALQYNQDMKTKYIDHEEYIHMLHGSRWEHSKKWLQERILYLDTLWDYDAQTADAITIRINKAGTVALAIQTYSPQYVTVKWRNNSLQKLKVTRNKTVSFSSYNPTATDQEVLIYSAKTIKSFGDISQMNPTAIDISQAPKLRELICSNATSLLNVNFGNNTFLRELNFSGCSKLGSNTANSRNLDVTNCNNLETINISGTQLTNLITNQNGGNLQSIKYPTTILNISLKNQPKLNELNIPSNSDLTTILLKNLSLNSSLSLNSKNISDIDIQNCSVESIYVSGNTDKILTSFTIRDLDNLSYLSLRKLKNIDTTSFEITRCPLINKITLECMDFTDCVFDFSDLPLNTFKIACINEYSYNDKYFNLGVIYLPKTLKNIDFGSWYNKDLERKCKNYKVGIKSNIENSETSILDLEGCILNNVARLFVLEGVKKNIYLQPINNPDRYPDAFNSVYSNGNLGGIENLTINLNEFKGTSIQSLFNGLDMNDITLIWDNILPLVTNVAYSFESCKNLDVSLLDKIPNMSNLDATFGDCQFTNTDIQVICSKIDFTKVTDCNYLFVGSNITGDVNIDTELSCDVSGMFKETNITKVTSFISSNIKSQYVFYKCPLLESVTNIKIAGLDTFNGCRTLSQISNLTIIGKLLNTLNNTVATEIDNLTLLGITDGSYSFEKINNISAITITNTNCSLFFKCVDLNLESKKRIIEALPDRTGESNIYKLVFRSINDLTDDEIAIATNKNWNVASA